MLSKRIFNTVLMKKVSEVCAGVCLLGFVCVGFVHAANPTINSIVITPSPNVERGTEVTVTIKATPADLADVFGYALYSRVYNFPPFVFGGGAYWYLPNPSSLTPGAVKHKTEYLDADGVFTWSTKGVLEDSYEIMGYVTVMSGPNKDAIVHSEPFIIKIGPPGKQGEEKRVAELRSGYLSGLEVEAPQRKFMNTLFFFDDWFLQAREGLDRKMGQPKQVNRVVLGRHPEINNIRGVRAIYYDEHRGRYVMTTDCWDKENRRFWIRLETDDPYNWTAPHWDSGSGPMWTRTENAYLDQHLNPLATFDILPLAGTSLADKGYFITFVDRGNATGFSQDGLHIEVNEKAPWMKDYGSDTTNTTIYNPWTGRYMIFCRPDVLDRRIAQIVTTDLETFSEPTVVLQPDAEDPVMREFYGMYPFLYDDVFLGMLWVYDAEPTEKGRYTMQGTNETQLAYSYNGQNWYRASRETFIARTEPGTPFGGSVYAFAPVRTPDNRLLFNSMGDWEDHGADSGKIPEEWKKDPHTTYLYEMRLDGFMYLKTRARHGLIRTKAVVPEGGEMTVNVRTTPSGYVKVAVLNEETHEPVANYTLEDSIPIRGDHLFAKVRWLNRENLDELKGKRVLLEVHIREGELYALRFTYRVAIGENIDDRLSR